jgi:hypothetical protein
MRGSAGPDIGDGRGRFMSTTAQGPGWWPASEGKDGAPACRLRLPTPGPDVGQAESAVGRVFSPASA